MGSEKVEQGQTLDLSGARVLLVEDEYYIADDLRRTLDSAGATVVGPCSTLARARQAVDEGAFDCAVIDLNLHGESAVSLAERLIELGSPSPSPPATAAPPSRNCSRTCRGSKSLSIRRHYFVWWSS